MSIKVKIKTKLTGQDAKQYASQMPGASQLYSQGSDTFASAIAPESRTKKRVVVVKHGKS